MAYLYKTYIVVDADSEDIKLQSKIDNAVEGALSGFENVEVTGEEIIELDENVCGRCSKCGVWVSDRDKSGAVEGFSDGCLMNGEWLCDLCLPMDHPKHF